MDEFLNVLFTHGCKIRIVDTLGQAHDKLILIFDRRNRLIHGVNLLRIQA